MYATDHNGLIESILSDPIKLLVALVGLIGLLLTLRKSREDSLRRDEVLAWADDCIAAIENLIVAAILYERIPFEEECRTRLINVAFDVPALIERGRIFFKNKQAGSFGTEKPPAYRGLRPRILDPLVGAHQIAVRFVDSDEETRARMQLVAEDYLKEFVSLVQEEVGRRKIAAPAAGAAGAGFDLQSALNKISTARVAHVREQRNRPLNVYRSRPSKDQAKTNPRSRQA